MRVLVLVLVLVCATLLDASAVRRANRLHRGLRHGLKYSSTRAFSHVLTPSRGAMMRTGFGPFRPAITPYTAMQPNLFNLGARGFYGTQSKKLFVVISKKHHDIFPESKEYHQPRLGVVSLTTVVYRNEVNGDELVVAFHRTPTRDRTAHAIVIDDMRNRLSKDWKVIGGGSVKISGVFGYNSWTCNRSRVMDPDTQKVVADCLHNTRFFATFEDFVESNLGKTWPGTQGLVNV